MTGCLLLLFADKLFPQGAYLGINFLRRLSGLWLRSEQLRGLFARARVFRARAFAFARVCLRALGVALTGLQPCLHPAARRPWATCAPSCCWGSSPWALVRPGRTSCAPESCSSRRGARGEQKTEGARAGLEPAAGPVAGRAVEERRLCAARPTSRSPAAKDVCAAVGAFTQFCRLSSLRRRLS